VLEGIGDEVPCRCLIDQIVYRFGGGQQCDRIEKNGRPAIDQVMGLKPASIRGRDAADFRRDQFAGGFLPGNRRHQPGIDPLGDEDTELAASKALGPRSTMLSDGERPRY